MSIRRALFYAMFGTTVVMAALLSGLANYWIRFLVGRIAEVHGGSVFAESQPGQWARFSLLVALPEEIRIGLFSRNSLIRSSGRR